MKFWFKGREVTGHWKKALLFITTTIGIIVVMLGATFFMLGAIAVLLVAILIMMIAMLSGVLVYFHRYLKRKMTKDGARIRVLRYLWGELKAWWVCDRSVSDCEVCGNSRCWKSKAVL